MSVSPFRPVRAAYAADSDASRGRLFSEPGSPSRTKFQRDRDRIIHSTAFRRLAHKTQVFIPHEGDHYRTRLTHSLEVAQIARALARALGLDDDLAEAVALAHDLGHPPFGHAGEDALHVMMAPYGGFDHNAQTLRIVTKLERRYAAFDGLNLTFETLEGLVKHNGPLRLPDGSPTPRFAKSGVPAAILEFDALFHLDLARFASAEAQAAAIADDIAYNAHDIDDGLRAGLIDVVDIAQAPFLGDLAAEVAALRPGLEPARFVHELVRRLITRFIEDAIGESRLRLDAAGAGSAEDIRDGAAPMVAFSPAMTRLEAEIKQFLLHILYRREPLNRIRAQAAEVIFNLFPHFFGKPTSMPVDWAAAAQAAGGDDTRRARVICDYIAGMTDRYVLQEHRRIFGAAPELR
ncbi:deoxyguanosinetriphosphate triphosphohydrolase [Methylocella silvestris BL2]|uniref:Deoxyguanosinetriphosphate triphosphohydrolase-like protein n=1 Tax=Methylocella silvestris (strain DSM 15510 / CIP 108128 / LMG 27833 / NCIMB 13906 / BL2) TaxID=395965 RepID=B8EJR2_METSB|nr:deoxyguanosinetriphosphate triphosphohydrolase [Methylocella silvestris]ACK49466.1 deoxyguanosinetriphosphate triphosphohydrolase [Methylocella silvestris BL2]